MDQVVDRVIALYMDNQRAYDDNPPSPGTTVGEEDGPGDAGRGYEDVNLAISFIDHALQAAQQAVQAQVDEETVVAALLHDIGWLAPKPKDATKLTSADEKIFLAKHDQVGASMLRQLGFTERLARLVEGHVQAKRYLTFKEADYYENLSAGSKFTLKHQGGPMSASEASAFEAEDDFPLYCLMRRWDEAAKIPDMKLPAFDSYRAAIRRCLSAGLWQPRRGYDVNDLLTESDLQSFQNQGAATALEPHLPISTARPSLNL
ncbi:uncharacterized protein MONBRDRAFT_9769 [Monosiga brevicollis MX1]|uniref:HD domain-containing protein n=1 Tax=Monosiga brevicollis TaxID=81824 RepID=A9V464_MONBE|nr:uncharacterized protein MONBRDRAFT_9769 [Monosiga brevicollis MX1]EDQ87651.1 predicted protein [Monosiga brevicollis MX1]|eukprot:XP_001747571.1 hypothetical protein [Monosiga brevicollis MX1]